MTSFQRLRGHRVYLDSKIFRFLVEGHATFQPPLTALFRSIKENAITAGTSELSLAECLVKPLADGNTRIADTYKRLLTDDPGLHVVPVSRDILVVSASLRAQLGGRAFDAIHVATAMDLGCTYFVSEDASIKLPDDMLQVRPSAMIAELRRTPS